METNVINCKGRTIKQIIKTLEAMKLAEQIQFISFNGNKRTCTVIECLTDMRELLGEQKAGMMHQMGKIA